MSNTFTSKKLLRKMKLIKQPTTKELQTLKHYAFGIKTANDISKELGFDKKHINSDQTTRTYLHKIAYRKYFHDLIEKVRS